MKREETIELLKSINYFENFKSNFMKRQYNGINFGEKIGIKSFLNFLDAGRRFDESFPSDKQQMLNWTNVLINENSTDEELLCTIIEIFNWGKVLNSNAINAINIYKSGNLKLYIGKIKDELTRNEIVPPKYELQHSGNLFQEIIWTSGWTKVYSFINSDFPIYDSRVAAFLNLTLVDCFDRKIAREFNMLTKYLFSFSGNTERKRKFISSDFAFKKGHPSKINGFNANLITSWIFQELQAQMENENADVRLIERSCFTLGFDLSQINPELIGNLR